MCHIRIHGYSYFLRSYYDLKSYSSEHFKDKVSLLYPFFCSLTKGPTQC